MADLNSVIRAWAAKREGVPQTHIVEVEFDYDAGWGGTDVTPGDEGDVIVSYTVVKWQSFHYGMSRIQDFISELCEVVPIVSENTRVQMPKDNLYDAAKGLVLQLKKDDMKLSAETRIARMLVERALEVD